MSGLSLGRDLREEVADLPPLSWSLERLFRAPVRSGSAPLRRPTPAAGRFASKVVWAIVSFLAFATLGCIYSTPEWSPDGRQLAFLAQAGDEDSIIPADCLLGAGRPAASSRVPEKRLRQIWIGRLVDRKFQLIEETPGWLSTPAWAPDGQSLAYVRFTPLEPDHDVGWGRLELVRRRRNGQSSVLLADTGNFPVPLLEALVVRPCAWSSDGRFVAAPWVGEKSLFVWNVVAGRLEAQWPTADLPSFSPDGAWLAMYDRGSKPGYRAVPSINWQAASKWIEAASAVQPAVWDPAGDAFYVAKPPFVFADSTGERSDFGIARTKVIRFAVDRIAVPSFDRQTAFYVSRPSQKSRQFSACYFDCDWSGETAFASLLADAVACRIDAVQLQEPGDSRSWHPVESAEIDSLIPLGSLRCSPDGRFLAVRFGAADWSAPLGVVSLNDRKMDVWTPNQAMRMRAIWTIVQSLIRQVRGVPPGAPMSYGIGREPTDENPYASLADAAGHPLEIFGLPAEVTSRLPTPTPARTGGRRVRIDDLSRQGLELVSHALADGVSDDLRRRLSEVELFFHYAREDFEPALRAILEVERWSGDRIDGFRRDALAVVRIQCLAGLRRWDAARWELARYAEGAADDDRVHEPGSRRASLHDEVFAARLRNLDDALHSPVAAPDAPRNLDEPGP